MKLRSEHEGPCVCLDFILEAMRNHLKLLKGRTIEQCSIQIDRSGGTSHSLSGKPRGCHCAIKASSRAPPTREGHSWRQALCPGSLSRRPPLRELQAGPSPFCSGPTEALSAAPKPRWPLAEPRDTGPSGPTHPGLLLSQPRRPPSGSGW